MTRFRSEAKAESRRVDKKISGAVEHIEDSQYPVYLVEDRDGVSVYDRHKYFKTRNDNDYVLVYVDGSSDIDYIPKSKSRWLLYQRRIAFL
jgi:hypothetical protein